jgi:hypothetical protein
MVCTRFGIIGADARRACAFGVVHAPPGAWPFQALPRQRRWPQRPRCSLNRLGKGML